MPSTAASRSASESPVHALSIGIRDGRVTLDEEHAVANDNHAQITNTTVDLIELVMVLFIVIAN